MTTEIATTTATGANMTALQVCQNADQIGKLGQVLAASGFFGQVNSSTATAALINCVMEGISPLEYRAKYHTMADGTTSVKSDYIQREFHRLGGAWKFNEWNGEVCDMTFTFKGETLPFRVTLDEFKLNGVACGKDGKTLKTNWAKFPREMLKARCMATAIRAICPEALGGMYTQEEVQDFDRAPTAPAAVKVSPSPIADKPVEAEVVDPAICPCGTVKGKPFAELPTATLEKILAAPLKGGLTAEHKNAIVAILGEREAAERGATEEMKDI